MCFVRYFFKIFLILICIVSTGFSYYNPGYETIWTSDVGANVTTDVLEGSYTASGEVSVFGNRYSQSELIQKRYFVEATKNGELEIRLISHTKPELVKKSRWDKEHWCNTTSKHGCVGLGYTILDVGEFEKRDFEYKVTYSNYHGGMNEVQPSSARIGQYFFKWHYNESIYYGWPKASGVKTFQDGVVEKIKLRKGDKRAIFIGFQDNWREKDRYYKSQYKFMMKFTPEPECAEEKSVQLEKKYNYKVNYKYSLTGKVTTTLRVDLPKNIKDNEYVLLYNLKEQGYNYKVVREENFTDCFKYSKEELKSNKVESLRPGDSVYFIIENQIGTKEFNFEFSLQDKQGNIPELDTTGGGATASKCEDLKEIDFFTKKDGAYINKMSWKLKQNITTKYKAKVSTQENGRLILDSSNKNIKAYVISDNDSNCGLTGVAKEKHMDKGDVKYIGIEISGKADVEIFAEFIPDKYNDLDTQGSCTPLNVNIDMQQNNDNVAHLGITKNGTTYTGHSWDVTSRAQDGVLSKYWVKIKAEVDGNIKLSGDSTLSYTLVEVDKANSTNCYNDDGLVLEKTNVKKGKEYYIGVKTIGNNRGKFSVDIISDQIYQQGLVQNCGVFSYDFTSTKDEQKYDFNTKQTMHSIQVLNNGKKVRNIYKFTVPTFGTLDFFIKNEDKDGQEVGKARVLRYDYGKNSGKEIYRKIEYPRNKCGQDLYMQGYYFLTSSSIPIFADMISKNNKKYEIVFIVDTDGEQTQASTHKYEVQAIWTPKTGAETDPSTTTDSKDETGNSEYSKDIPEAIPSDILEDNAAGNGSGNVPEKASFYDRDFGLIWGGAGTFVYGDVLTAASEIFQGKNNYATQASRMESNGRFYRVDRDFNLNSSLAKIKLPYGLKGNQVKIKYARLFWQGHIHRQGWINHRVFANLIKGYRSMGLKIQGGKKHMVNATMVNHVHTVNISQGPGLAMLYSASADVTNIVSQAIEHSSENLFNFIGGEIVATEGVEGDRQQKARNLSANREDPKKGMINSRLGPLGGWSLTLVYEVKEDGFDQDKFMEIAKPKQVSIFAGYKLLEALNDIGTIRCRNLYDQNTRKKYCVKGMEIPIAGFYTPDTNDFDAKITITMAGGEFGLEDSRKATYYPAALDELRVNSEYEVRKDGIKFKDRDENWKLVGKDFQKLMAQDTSGNRHTYEIGDDTYKNVFNGGYSAVTYQVGPKFGFMKPRQTAINVRFSVAAAGLGWGGAMSDEAFVNMIAFSTDLYMPDICYEEKIYNTAGWLKFFDKNKNFERIKNPSGAKPVTSAVIENEPLYYRVVIKNRQKSGKALGTVVTLKLGATNTYQPNTMAIDNKSAVEEEYSTVSHKNFDIDQANLVYIKDNDLGAFTDAKRETKLNDAVYNGRQFNDTRTPGIIKIPVGYGAGVDLGGGTLRGKEWDKVFLEFNATAGRYFELLETNYKVGFRAVDDSGKELANFDYGLPMKRCEPKTDYPEIVILNGLQITNKNYKKDGDDDSIYTQIAGKEFDAKLVYQPDMTKIFPCLDPKEEQERLASGKACTIYNLDLIRDRILKEYFKCDVPKGQIASNVCTEDQKRGKTLKNGLQKFKLEGPLYLSLIDAKNKVHSSGTPGTSDKEEIFGCDKDLKENNYITFNYDDKKSMIRDPKTGGYVNSISLNENGKNMMFGKEMIDLKKFKIDDAYKNATFMLTYYPVGLDRNNTQDDVDNQKENSKIDASNAKTALQVGQGPDGSFRVCNSDNFSIRPAFLSVNKANIKGSAYLLNKKTNELKVINDKPRVGGKFEDNKDLLTTILQPVSYGGQKLYGYNAKLSTTFDNSAVLREHIQTGKYYKDLTEDQKYRENKIYLRPYISNECRDVGYIPQFYYSSKIDNDKKILDQNHINPNDYNAVKNCFYNKTEANCLPHYREYNGKCYLDKSTISPSQTKFYCYSPYQYSNTFSYLEDGTNSKYTKYENNQIYYGSGNLNKIWNMDKIRVTLEFGAKCSPNKDGGCFDSDKTNQLPDQPTHTSIQSQLIKVINNKNCGNYRGCQDSFITTQKIDNNESIFNYYNVGDVELRVVDNSWISAAKDDIVGDREASCIINSSTNIEDDKGRIGCDIAIKDDVKGDELSLILRYIPDRIEVKTTGLENGGSYEYDGNKLSSNFTFFTRPSLVRDGKDLRILTNLGYGIRNNKAIVQNTQNLARVKFQTQAFIAGPKQNGRTVYKYGDDGEQPLIATLFDGQVKRIYDGANYHKVPICGFAFDVPTNLEFKFDCDDAKYANDERCLTNAEIKKEVIEKLSFTKRQYKPFYNMSYEVSFPNGSYFKDCVGKNAKFDSRCFVTGTMSNKNGEEHESETQIHIPLKYAINYYSDYSEQSGIINSYDSTFNFFNPKSSAYTFIKEGFKGGKGENLSAYINFDRSEKIAMLPVWVEVKDFELTGQKDTNGKIKDKIDFTLKTPRFDKDGNLVNSAGNPINYLSSGKDIGAGNEYDIINSSDIVDMTEQSYKNIDMTITTQNLEHNKNDLVNRIKDSALFVYGALNHEGSLTKLTPISAKLSGNASNATEVRFENFIYCPANNNCYYIPLVNDAGQNYVDVLPNTIKDANNMVFKHITQIAPSRAKDPSSGFIKNPFNLFDNLINNFAIDYVTQEPRLEIQRANQFDPFDITKDNKFVSEKVKMQKKTSTSNAFSTKPGQTYLQVKPWYVYSKNMGTSSRTYGNPYLYGETDMRNHFIVRFTSISEWAGRGGASGGSDKNVGNVAGGKDLNMTSSRTQRRSNW